MPVALRLRRVCRAALLAAEALVTRVELLDATGGVHDALLAGVERVRLRGDLDVDDRVGVSVFPLDRLGAADGRPRTERRNGRKVTEGYGCVLGVNARLHGCSLN